VARTSVVIPLPCDAGHTARCTAAIAGDTGWNISLEIDDHIVSMTHCSDWHRVERVCAQIERVWLRDYAPPSTRA
jgi:hypothetical protein